MVAVVDIAGRKIGPGHPCFIIAEAGVNHNGSLELARKLVDVAVEAGADAVKFQTFKAEKVASSSAPKANYQKETTGSGESQLEMAKKLELSYPAFRELYAYCQERGILFLSTPFDEQSADFLEGLGVAAFKVPSGEITNLPFLEHLARKGKPLIVSTGMSTLEEVETAVRIIKSAGNPDLILLHCVSNYPADPADANLRAMHTLQVAFDIPVGFSDHTLGTHIPVAAVALGAEVIEKHFTLSKSLVGPDHTASLEPDQLRLLVQEIRDIERALGTGLKVRQISEDNTAAVARRSIFSAHPMRQGSSIKLEDLVALRPGTGIPVNRMVDLVGRRLTRDIPSDTILKEEDFE